MSLDFQKTTYTRKRKNEKKTRTSYRIMNTWLQVAKDDLPNPYASAAEQGVYRRVEHMLDVPLEPGERYADKGYHPPPQSELFSPAVRRTPRISNLDDAGSRRRKEDRAYLQRVYDERKTVVPELPVPGPISAQYNQSGGYDDYHKTFLGLKKLDISPTYPMFGPPRLRNGRVGGSWRHIKEVLQAKGKRTLFVDGEPRGYDNCRITNTEAPAVDLIQPAVSEPQLCVRPPIIKNPRQWTQHDLDAFKASEAGNWLIMR